MNALKGCVALVTGASRGIGAAVAVELARMGAHCVITGRTQGGLEESDDAIRAVGGSASLVPLDLIEGAEQIDLLGPSIVERFGRLDIVVHAAGWLGKLTPVAHIEPRDFTASLAVNLTATWRLIRSVEPPLRAAPAGRAVVLTDQRAAAPSAYFGLYSAAKAGVIGATKASSTSISSTSTQRYINGVTTLFNQLSTAYPNIDWAIAGLPYIPYEMTYAPIVGTAPAWDPSRTARTTRTAPRRS
ncbi:MAG: SDR family NAD(P)-dependent oxidoreductase [Alphaproteobacteria bacterium]|nr:SDR family NAD(P)-dependent oxidoreductase [Alphaproteobacteria bacterium]